MIILLSALLLASETPVAVAPATDAPAAAETPKEEKKICKREAATESRLGSKRICLTAAQWRERHDAELRGLDDAGK